MPKIKKLQIENPMVAEVFLNYPATIREKLLFLRELVLAVAKTTKGVGLIEETLKWGEPSYLTSQSKSGTTIRMHIVRNDSEQYALYFNCKTNLIDRFRIKYATKLKFSGNRAILFDLNEKIPIAVVKDCLRTALTYNQNKIKNEIN